MSLKKVVYRRNEEKQNLKWMKVLLEQVVLEHLNSKRNILVPNSMNPLHPRILRIYQIIIVISAHIQNFKSFQNTVRLHRLERK